MIGGGAVGLCVAEALSARGAEVTVLERDRCGAGASAGNAGWVTPSLSTPVPGPGVIAASLRWLIDPSGPLWIRPTLAPSMLAWIARFLRSCSRSAHRRGLGALQAAAAGAGPAFERVAGRGVSFELHDDPLLYPAFDRDELEHVWGVAGELRDAGTRQSLERLGPEEVLELEPAIAPSVVGGVLAGGEWRVRPEGLVRGLVQGLGARGVSVREGCPVDSIVRDGSRWRVLGESSVEADAVVIAAGVGSGELLAPLGFRLPIAAAKGYSRTYPLDPSGPKRPLYLERPKVSISVFDEAVRISGTLELGARGLALSQRRLAAIADAAQHALPGWRMSTPADWAGIRSLSPDGLPFIGAMPGAERLFIATAHATLGITLAPLTGELLASLILEAKSDPVLAAFDPARALRR